MNDVTLLTSQGMPSNQAMPTAGEFAAMSEPHNKNAPEFAAASLEAWTKAAAKSAPGGNVDALNWVTPDGITVKPLYTAEDTASLPYANTPPASAP